MFDWEGEKVEGLKIFFCLVEKKTITPSLLNNHTKFIKTKIIQKKKRKKRRLMEDTKFFFLYYYLRDFPYLRSSFFVQKCSYIVMFK